MLERDVICALFKNPLVQNRNVIILEIPGLSHQLHAIKQEIQDFFGDPFGASSH